MDPSDLSEAASARELPTLSMIVGNPAVSARLAAPAAPDERLDPPRSKNASEILALLARRGLDPDALTWLMPQLDPIERALVAWDVLAGSLLKADGELAAFRDLAADAAAIMAAPAQRGCTADIIAALAPRFGDSAKPTNELLEEAGRGKLAAVIELRTRGPEFATRARAEIPRIRDQAALLARAHFATLASLQLGLLWRAFDDREALIDWIDVLADLGHFDSLPSLDRVDAPARSYIEYRVAVAAADPVAAMSAARSLSPGDGLRAAAVRVDVAIRTKRRDENAERALSGGIAMSSCRFAGRVDTVARILAGEPASTAIDRFLGRFGNDFDFWRDLAAQADRVADLPATCEAIIARELRWLPHDPVAWRALALMIGEPVATAITTELDQRLIRQSTMA